jgi:hypothetical protein
MELFCKSTPEDIIEGYVLMPYTIKIVSTSINSETVWYLKKWKNLLLKIKHFFIKPKYLKNVHFYKRPVNSSFYDVVKITGDKNKREK